MASEKRLIDANALGNGIGVYVATNSYLNDTAQGALEMLGMWVCDAPTVDAVEVDTVIEMFEYMLGDCPCNFSPVDEWLAEQCELQEECPNPKDKRGCWKQFIKHFCAKMEE